MARGTSPGTIQASAALRVALHWGGEDYKSGHLLTCPTWRGSLYLGEQEAKILLAQEGERWHRAIPAGATADDSSQVGIARESAGRRRAHLEFRPRKVCGWNRTEGCRWTISTPVSSVAGGTEHRIKSFSTWGRGTFNFRRADIFWTDAPRIFSRVKRNRGTGGRGGQDDVESREDQERHPGTWTLGQGAAGINGQELTIARRPPRSWRAPAPPPPPGLKACATV
jgi:hypothetical protein